MDVRDSRIHNYPPRWNGAPSQDLLVIRRNRIVETSLYQHHSRHDINNFLAKRAGVKYKTVGEIHAALGHWSSEMVTRPAGRGFGSSVCRALTR
jgi:hypothetical protein